MGSIPLEQRFDDHHTNPVIKLSITDGRAA